MTPKFLRGSEIRWWAKERVELQLSPRTYQKYTFIVENSHWNFASNWFFLTERILSRNRQWDSGKPGLSERYKIAHVWREKRRRQDVWPLGWAGERSHVRQLGNEQTCQMPWAGHIRLWLIGKPLGQLERLENLTRLRDSNIKYMNNKDTLYSTGNYSNYLAII